MKLSIEKFNLTLASSCLSISELSAKCGVSTVTLGKLKNGYTARPQTIGKIARGLNVNVAELIED